MRITEKVLKVICRRGEEGKPLERLYRQLFKPELYWQAYSQIYSNAGATTRGTGEDTIDGMSQKRIDSIIQRIKTETYRWNPVRRTYIPKGNGESRPLGMPSGDDKLLQAAIKLLLESYYEPQFSDRSHGFRPGRGCHTALKYVDQKHRNTTWFIEGDIKGCFDNIDHKILMDVLAERIKDGRFLRLIRNLLGAGYMENWRYNNTPSGTPQGGVVSPLLANIYLDVFDKWVETELLPRFNHSQNSRKDRNGKMYGIRKRCPEYSRITRELGRAVKAGDLETARQLRKLRLPMPSVMVNDPEYRKLEYLRYADDFLLSFAGPKSEAVEIKEEIREFLKERLNLELSPEKTLITHARTEKARFLGYDLKIMHRTGRKKANGNIWYGVPHEVITEAKRKYMRNGKTIHRFNLQNDSDYAIVKQYQTEHRGLVQYFQMAHNLSNLSKVHYVAQGSLLKTLAGKNKTSMMKMKKKYGTTKRIKGVMYKVLEVEVQRKEKKPLVTHFGGVTLARNARPTVIIDEYAKPATNPQSELLDRLMKNECELCGSNAPLEAHHVRGLKDLKGTARRPLKVWERRQLAMSRKVIAICWPCHKAIHTSVHRKEWDTYRNMLESRVL